MLQITIFLLGQSQSDRECHICVHLCMRLAEFLLFSIKLGIFPVSFCYQAIQVVIWKGQLASYEGLSCADKHCRGSVIKYVKVSSHSKNQPRIWNTLMCIHESHIQIQKMQIVDQFVLYPEFEVVLCERTKATVVVVFNVKCPT